MKRYDVYTEGYHEILEEQVASGDWVKADEVLSFIDTMLAMTNARPETFKALLKAYRGILVDSPITYRG